MSDNFTKNKMRWLEQVTFDTGLLAQHRCTGHAIARHLSRVEGCARPSIPRLAIDLGVSENTVRAGIKQLVSRGHITVVSGGGRNTANRYWIVLKDAAASAEPHTSEAEKPSSPHEGNEGEKPPKEVQGNCAEKGCSPLQGIEELPFNSGSETLQSSGGKPFNRLNPNHLIEPLREPEEEYIFPGETSAITLESEFSTLWKQYPRKVSRGSALKAFKAARKKTDFNSLMHGVCRYAAERADQDPRFTKHFASWLNAECWSDEPAPLQSTATDQGQNRSGPWRDGKERTRAALRIVRENSA